MTAWAAKRFWTDVSVVAQDGGFAVKLDGRAVRTPAKTELIVPSAALAEAIAEEWRAVEGAIDPEVMPFTRSANAALDKVAVQFDEVVAMLGPTAAAICFAIAPRPPPNWSRGRPRCGTRCWTGPPILLVHVWP